MPARYPSTPCALYAGDTPAAVATLDNALGALQALLSLLAATEILTGAQWDGLVLLLRLLARELEAGLHDVLQALPLPPEP